MSERSKQPSSFPASEASSLRRRPWVAPRLQDHGSLRTFVRQLSGDFDDGQAPPQGQGGMMETMRSSSSSGGD